MMAHIQKYKSHYLLAVVLSLFWGGVLFATPMVKDALGLVASECGNGVIEGGEVCDDGDATNFGTCNATCFELTRCGDGTLQNPDGMGVAEQCDDLNLISGDGCSTACEIEPPVCGNGRVEMGESCDDNNMMDGDGCSATCQIEIPSPVCGNGNLETGELCDDGNILDGDGCSALCTIEPLLPVCGNATVETGEICDEGPLNGTPNHCDLTCSGTTAAVCGNATVESGEMCDDGNTLNNDGCSATCQIEVISPVCGNGNLETGELCDEGPLNGTPNHCDLTCSGTTAAVCGNATVESGEMCDDGNTVNTDSCLNSCVLAVCGDGFVKLDSEQCDDGNNANGDGCSATCAVELPACVEPAIKISFKHVEIVNAAGWANQVTSGEKTFALTHNSVTIPFSKIEQFQSNLRNAFQVGWEGSGQEKHLRIGSMKQTALNSRSKVNYGIELDYTVEFLGDVDVTRFQKMNLNTRNETIVFNDGKIVYRGDRTDGTDFLTGNGPSDDWSKFFLNYKECEEDGDDDEDEKDHEDNDQKDDGNRRDRR